MIRVARAGMINSSCGRMGFYALGGGWRERGREGAREGERGSLVARLIDGMAGRSYDSCGTRWYDKFQLWTNGIMP